MVPLLLLLVVYLNMILVKSTNLAHRMFYVASPPFHGNKLLSQLFATCDKVSSQFETKPRMGGHILIYAAREGLTKTYVNRKQIYLQPTIATVDALPAGWMYANTDPMFAHTFHDIVLRDFANKNAITIILLRDHPARSLSRLKSHATEISFFATPNDKQNEPGRYKLYTQHTRLATTLPLKSFKDSSEEELLIGYLIDIESRRQQIRSVSSRFRKVNVVDVWYDELTDIESVKYLLETRLQIPNCETSKIQHILNQHQHDKYSRKELKMNNYNIQQYLLHSRTKAKNSKIISLPSMVLPSGTVPTKPANCILHATSTADDNYLGCAQNLPILDVSMMHKKQKPIFFWNPVQISVGDQPIFYFGVNKMLPIPSVYGAMRSAIIKTELLENDSLKVIGEVIHEVAKSTRIIESTIMQTKKNPKVRNSVLQLSGDCKSFNTFQNVICHPIPLSLDRTLSYKIRLTVTSLTEKWITLGWFSF
jgi:hypothetical protein